MKLAIGIILAVIFYRTLAMSGIDRIEWLPNFAPVTALALCGAIFLPWRYALGLLLGGLLVSDMLINAAHGLALVSVEMLPRYLALGLVFAIGLALRNHPRLPLIFGATLLSAILFYVITNTFAWLGSPLYAPTLAGWIQAQTVGLPGYPPSWVFFRNAVAGDFLFTGVFLAALAFAQRPFRVPRPFPTPQTS